MTEFGNEIRRNRIVSRIIITPYFRQSPAVPACDKEILRWLGSFGFGFLSPQPPGIVGAEPNAETTHWANESWSFLVFRGALSFRTARSDDPESRDSQVRNCAP